MISSLEARGRGCWIGVRLSRSPRICLRAAQHERESVPFPEGSPLLANCGLLEDFCLLNNTVQPALYFVMTCI